MKKILFSSLAAVALLVSCDPSTLQNAISTATNGISSTDLVNGLGALIENATSNENITEADIVGTWSYSAPAVSFKSDNFLKKAGGVAAATAIESKLKPYYLSAGIDKTVLTVNNDKSFAMKVGKTTLKGTLQKDTANNMFVFNFSILGFNAFSSSAFVAKSATGTIAITFDVSKLEKIVTAVATFSGNSTAQSVASLLSSYDGIRAGFRMKT